MEKSSSIPYHALAFTVSKKAKTQRKKMMASVRFLHFLEKIAILMPFGLQIAYF